MVPNQSVFKDESKLDINYIPQKLPHREKEQRLLSEFFSFILRCPERMAQRVILTGDVGTGKTALAQHFGANITSEANKRRIKFRYVHVNCREFRGSLQTILHRAVMAFRPNYPARGYGAEEVLAALMQVLDEEEATMILALDEFDSLIEKEGSDAVYKLTRLQEMRQGKPQRLSFIFIMRNLDATAQLDESARSTLQRSIISLTRYGKPQLIDILSDRVALAFELGAVSEDVVDLVAELAYSETGNARFGIELLWRAGKYADAENAGVVEPECVRLAISSIVPSLRRSELASLGLHERLFLLAVARYFKENEEVYAALTEIEKTYAVLCEEYGETANSHTQLWNYAQYLTKLGVLRTEVASAETRGRTTRVSLPTIPAVELERQLSDSLTQNGRRD
ncbi:MAG: ORC1-type DNA replication protein [Candidatus Bathyarchaeota archaeon]|nr:ORC1-type DNA replication protein [Candidatus Bathyarchaeota archaeon]